MKPFNFLVVMAIVAVIPSVGSAQSGSRGSGYRPPPTRSTPTRSPPSYRPRTTNNRGPRRLSTPASSYVPQNSITLHGLSGSGAVRTVAPVRPQVSYPGRSTTRPGSSRTRAVSSPSAGSAFLNTVSGVTTPVVFSTDESQTLRPWDDNTGTFQIVARLMEVHSQKVILLKENGRQAGVPWRRLSVKDQEFVRARLAALIKSETG